MVSRLIIVLFVDVVNNVCTKELVVEDDSSIVDVVVDAHTVRWWWSGGDRGRL